MTPSSEDAIQAIESIQKSILAQRYSARHNELFPGKTGKAGAGTEREFTFELQLISQTNLECYAPREPNSTATVVTVA